jgi:hypothetical protein
MRWRTAIGTALAALAATAAPAAAAIEPGGTAFWSGGTPCGERCWERHLDLAPGGWRLRVGIDKHTVADGWRAEVRGPAGGGSIDVPTGLYSGETFIEQPAGGRYTVRVTAEAGAQDLRFRGRAKLERKPSLPSPPVDELPNLQAMPPWDLTFDYPLTNGTTDPPQRLPTPGGRLGCHMEELPATRCLRMAFGVRNTGRGPMDLFLGAGVQPDDRPLIQRAHRSDGSFTERDAGFARFHASHGHYHHDGAISLELLEMDGAPAAELRLKGFAHRNELLREWTRFHPTWDTDGFGLTAGWGDYYEWDRPGNFIDFGLNPDGRYVLRLTADPVGGILESNEADNAGYSVVDVAGDQVTLLESGRGSGPWDRCRILMPLGPEPELPGGMAQHPRPADCPLDTIDVDAPAVAATPASPPATSKPATKPAVKKKKVKKKKAKRRRCPKLRRGMSSRRRAAVRRCRRAQQRRTGSRRG